MAAHQAPPSLGFSRQEHWSGLPLPSLDLLYVTSINVNFFKLVSDTMYFSFIFGCAGSSLLRVGFLSLQWVGATLHGGAWASHCSGFSCCGAQAIGLVGPKAVGFSACGAQAQLLQGTWNASRTRDQTCVPCTGREIPIHCPTREVLLI